MPGAPQQVPAPGNLFAVSAPVPSLRTLHDTHSRAMVNPGSQTGCGMHTLETILGDGGQLAPAQPVQANDPSAEALPDASRWRKWLRR